MTLKPVHATRVRSKKWLPLCHERETEQVRQIGAEILWQWLPREAAGGQRIEVADGGRTRLLLLLLCGLSQQPACRPLFRPFIIGAPPASAAAPPPPPPLSSPDLLRPKLRAAFRHLRLQPSFAGPAAGIHQVPESPGDATGSSHYDEPVSAPPLLPTTKDHRQERTSSSSACPAPPAALLRDAAALPAGDRTRPRAGQRQRQPALPSPRDSARVSCRQGPDEAGGRAGTFPAAVSLLSRRYASLTPAVRPSLREGGREGGRESSRFGTGWGGVAWGGGRHGQGVVPSRPSGTGTEGSDPVDHCGVVDLFSLAVSPFVLSCDFAAFCPLHGTSPGSILLALYPLVRT
ncbi:hypothetical protein AXG93_2550s1450 [Marchantia polymorpha subsp. ruderalis]|uniref:Uncharacterized protein n=1 Tax=Marchantia polymorpha subsp. ruderalis TaxID=1480154 RepID=A0A176VPM8_MARPO|nr:hypothetical protein AXG93_2550s1450 [Marchantia polymorpha subsp. ruderalis]